MRISRLSASVSLAAIALVHAGRAAASVTTPAPTPAPQPHGVLLADATTKLNTKAPKGFEDLDGAVSTQFDLTFLGRPVGAFAATFKDGQIQFADPARVAAALGPGVDTAAVTAFLSKSLPANEQFRCRPGQSPNVGCGLLPAGTSGVIVNVESFNVSLFLTRDFLSAVATGPRMLGAPESGPSLIQGARMSVASMGGGRVTYGGIFDTLASVGRNALIGQATLTSDAGLRTQQLYAQRIWSDRRAAVGLIQDTDSASFNTFRLRGAEFGSFYGTMLDLADDTATPLEVVLPKRAQVEIYRDNVLLATGQYEGGLQLLNTATLPNGSYPVRIVVRDGTQVLLEQTRTFSKLGAVVPPGKTAFHIRVGERVEDTFSATSLDGQNRGFLPGGTGEFVTTVGAQRRLGRSIVAGADVMSFGSRVFGEASVQLFHGPVSGMVAAGGGSDGSYSGLVSGTVQLSKVNFYLSGRIAHAPQRELQGPQTDNHYLPFFSSQKTVFASVQTPLFGGSFGLSGSYTHTVGSDDHYAVGLNYSRSMRLPLIGTALLNGNATISDFDKRFGISVTFFKAVDSKTTASFTGGGQYVTNAVPGAGRSGFSPQAEAIVSRSERLGVADIVGQAGASTDADSDRVFGQLRAESSYGSADATVQYQGRNANGSHMQYLGNLQTGFAVGGGEVKLGLRNPSDAMVLVDLRKLKTPASAPDASASQGGDGDASDAIAGDAIADGGYRINVDGRTYDFVKPGMRAAIGLTALNDYALSLRPEGAPQFDLDATTRRVSLYPGNVVRLRFEAQRVVSLFGQVVDRAGKPMASARVSAGSDFAVADDHGFFTITAPLNATVDIKGAAGESCTDHQVGSLIKAGDPVLLYRIGKLTCR